MGAGTGASGPAPGGLLRIQPLTLALVSNPAAASIRMNLTRFIEKKLRLKVNQDKSKVAKPEERHFLGFTLKRDEETGEVAVKLSERTKKRIGEKIRELTPRNWGQSLKDCIKRLNSYLQGWIGFFGICTESERRLLGYYDGHIRRRLRAIKLKQWKRKRTIVKALIKLGANAKIAWNTIYKGKRSLWQLSHSPAVDRGLRNTYMVELGLKSLRKCGRPIIGKSKLPP